MNKNELQTENRKKGRKLGTLFFLLKVSSIFEEKIDPWKKNFIYAVLQNEAKYFQPGSIAWGIQRYYITFVFDPLHLPLIASEKYPVRSFARMRLTGPYHKE